MKLYDFDKGFNIVVVVVVLVSLFFSVKKFELYLGQYAFMLPKEYNREMLNRTLYGKDYEVWKLLQDSPRDSKILFIAPDVLYKLKSQLFLYPREVTAVYNPLEIQNYDLENYDFVYMFVSSTKNHGAIRYGAKQRDWDFMDLLMVEKYILKEKSSQNFDKFMKKLEEKDGSILYIL